GHRAAQSSECPEPAHLHQTATCIASYLIDSMRVMDALKGTPAARDLSTRLTNEPLAISLITYGEVYEGIYYGPSRRVSEEAYRLGMEERQIPVAAGQLWSVRQGNGPAVLLCHGGPGLWDYLAPIAEMIDD